MNRAWVYAAVCDGYPLVKIGASKNPHNRVKCFKREGGDFKVAGLLEGGFTKEREVHAILAESRSFGEWFWHTDKVREFISTMIPPDNFVFPETEPLDKTGWFDVKQAKIELMQQIVKAAAQKGCSLAQLCERAGVSTTIGQRHIKNGAIPMLPTIGKLETALAQL